MSNYNRNEFSDELHKACDPFYLGRNRQMGDPNFSVQGTQWQADLENEMNATGSFPMEHYRMSHRLQYGRTALRPGLWPNRIPANVRRTLERCKEWIRDDHDALSTLIRVKEVEIQQHILGVSEATLKGYLDVSWREAKRSFNQRAPWILRHHGFNESMGYSYTLDVGHNMPRFHAPDLDLFVTDFVKDDLGQTRAGEPNAQNDILIPLFRFGHNYKDLSRPDRPWHYNDPEPKSEKGGPVDYNNQALRSHLERARSTYLAPHINHQDLIDTGNLLTFIHYRSRVRPEEFSSLDNALTYTGRHARLLSGPLQANEMTRMLPQLGRQMEVAHGYGPSPAPSENAAEYRSDYNKGYIFGDSETYVLLLSQLLTYSFLRSFCYRVAQHLVTYDSNFFDEVRKTIEDNSPQIKATLIEGEKKARAKVDEELSTQPRDPAILGQYEPVAPGIDVGRFLPRLEDKNRSASVHIYNLFNDPDYFATAIMEEREHHWLNTAFSQGSRRLRMEQYSEERPRHRLYLDLLRRVTRRAVFERYLWSTTRERLWRFNEAVLNAHPHYNLRPALLNNFDPWPRPPVLLNTGNPDMHSALFEQYLELVTLVRYHAIFFLNEFRIQAIHIGIKPFRENFLRSERNTFQNAHYGGTPFHLEHNISRDGTTDDKCILLELIDNLIADEGASMHVGIRKVTHRLQFLLADPEDAVWKHTTPLISDTIAKLDLLADLAEHLESWHPAVEKLAGLADEERKQKYRHAAHGLSLDFFKFDEFRIDEAQCVPDKRMNRLYSFLDEMQQFQTGNVRSLGFARGDLKRYGSSIVRHLIEKTHPRDANMRTRRAETGPVRRLARGMAVRAEDYPFREDEQPLDVGHIVTRVNGNLVERRQPDQQKYAGEAAKWRKKALNRRSSSTGFPKPALEKKRANVIRRRETKMLARLAKRQADEARAAAAAAAEAALTPAAVPQIVPEMMEVDDAISNMRDVFQDIALAAPVALPPPVQPPPQPAPQPAPAQPQPVPAQLQPAPAPPLAPDGLPKRELKRSVWATIEGLYRINESRYPLFKEVAGLLSSMGYRDTEKGGGHVTFTLTNRCPIPQDALPRAKSIILSKQHGPHGTNERSKSKARIWAAHLRSNGVTYDFLEAWFRRP